MFENINRVMAVSFRALFYLVQVDLEQVRFLTKMAGMLRLQYYLLNPRKFISHIFVAAAVNFLSWLKESW